MINNKIGILRFRKQHQVFLKRYFETQKIQSHQKKTLDSFILKNYFTRVVCFEEYEALRRILSRKLLRLLRFSLVSQPFGMVTAKPKEIRMGKGKGSFSHFVLPTKSGGLFAKIFWCQAVKFCPLFLLARNACRKSGQRFNL